MMYTLMVSYDCGGRYEPLLSSDDLALLEARGQELDKDVKRWTIEDENERIVGKRCVIHQEIESYLFWCVATEVSVVPEGTKITCEEHHPICTIGKPLRFGDAIKLEEPFIAFDAQQQPPQRGMLWRDLCACRICGKFWMRPTGMHSIAGIHTEAGWVRFVPYMNN